MWLCLTSCHHQSHRFIFMFLLDLPFYSWVNYKKSQIGGSINGVYPQIIQFNRIFPYKSSSELGYPHNGTPQIPNRHFWQNPPSPIPIIWVATLAKGLQGPRFSPCLFVQVSCQMLHPWEKHQRKTSSTDFSKHRHILQTFRWFNKMRKTSVK